MRTAVIGAAIALSVMVGSFSAGAKELVMIVMDPLAKELSCPCVEGYAQRDYHRLGEYLSKQTERNVRVVFGESISAAIQRSGGAADIVIGKYSVVLSDMKTAKVDLQPIAQLTDKMGKTTQTGLLLVRAQDPAQTVKDLSTYRILFGPEESEEKHAAIIDLLRGARVELPDEREIAEACSDGATLLLELPKDKPGAAAISSYARPLLEGCGTIEAGALRVVGETEPVPFVTAFLNRALDAKTRASLQKAVLNSRDDHQLLQSLESLMGFVPCEFEDRRSGKKTDAVDPSSRMEWPAWRGAHRDALVASLPDQLPSVPNVVWRYAVSPDGMGGIAAANGCVIWGDRDPMDTADIFTCVEADSGAMRWKVIYGAPGHLDYGNSPRATAWIGDSYVLLAGAHGHLHCVDLESGAILWLRNLASEFGEVESRPWGYCESPLVVDGRVIVRPGAPDAAIVALAASDGSLIWKTPGAAPAYGSLVRPPLEGSNQVVGFDSQSLGGWSVQTGKRLWTVVLDAEDDFNVPTPLPLGNQLLVASENNGVRLFQFSGRGQLATRPVATSDSAFPDMVSPVAANGRVFLLQEKLICLAADPHAKGQQLAPIWSSEEDAFSTYGSLIASTDRLLVFGATGELLLYDISGDVPRLTSRMSPFGKESLESYSHPALVGERIYLRGGTELLCVDLRHDGKDLAD